MTHDWSFLQGDKRHNHTLKAGHHSFPFSLMLDGNLPSSIHTHNGECNVTYKLRANVVRSGFSSNFHTSRTFTLHRTYMNEALEFNQTLEIENTWPGKIMYSLTLPFKAYAAGDEIPVMLKFMPLAKGVRVMTVQSVLKEYTLVHTRHSQHSDQRVAASVKHELRKGKAYLVPENHTGRVGGRSTATTPAASASNSRAPSPSRTPMPARTSSSSRPGDSYFPTQTEGAGPSTGEPASDTEDEDITIGDDEINASISIPIPAHTTPSHTIHPVYVTHKIKWSCSISNADGHVSELRCALPIIILNHSMLEEARSASAATRSLLFGTGNPDDAQVIDLPSYNNHVYDRVAVADSGQTSGFRSTHATPLHSPSSPTPPGSLTPSRPGSPTRRSSMAIEGNHQLGVPDVPPRRELSSYADTELLASLGDLNIPSMDSSPRDSPTGSRAPSRPMSRRNSRSGRSSKVNSRHGSRQGSRANSPERSDMADRRVSSFTGLLHLGQTLKHRAQSHHNHHNLPTKPILRASGHNTPAEELSRTSSSSNIGERNHVRIGGETRNFYGEDEQPDPISRVPSYAIASRGWLGGGITPLDTGLPTYNASESTTSGTRSSNEGLIRPRSDTALVNLGRANAEDEA